MEAITNRYNSYPKLKDRTREVALLCLLKAIISFFFIVGRELKKVTTIYTSEDGVASLASAKTIASICSIVFIVPIYATLNKRFRQEVVLTGILGFFFSFFLLNIFLFLPYEAHLVKTDLIGNNRLIYCLRLLHFLLAEFWNHLCIVLFFWGVTNELFNRKEAKQYYHYFIAAGSTGGMLGALGVGLLQKSIVNIKESGTDKLKLAIEKHLCLLNLSEVTYEVGLASLFFIFLVYRLILRSSSRKEQKASLLQRAEEKTKLSFSQSVSYIFKDPYLRAILFMVLGYICAITLVDYTHEQYLDMLGERKMSKYLAYKSLETFMSNALCAFSCLLLSNFVMQRFGWTVMALIMPIIATSFGVIFLGGSVLISGHYFGLSGKLALFRGVSLAQFIGYLGIVQRVGVTGARYAFGEGAKEVAYAGMNVEGRRNGKAAIDIAGNRFGKGLANATHSILFYIMGTKNVLELTPVLLVLFLGFTFGWFRSIFYLGPRLDRRHQQQQAGMNLSGKSS